MKEPNCTFHRGKLKYLQNFILWIFESIIVETQALSERASENNTKSKVKEPNCTFHRGKLKYLQNFILWIFESIIVETQALSERATSKDYLVVQAKNEWIIVWSQVSGF